jgi:hypothetical protein
LHVAEQLLQFLKLVDEDRRFQKEEMVVLAMRRYDMFMKLKVKYPLTFLVPTLDIEMVWQSHLLRPVKYKEDCLKNYRTFIDHAFLANEAQQAFLDRGLEETAELWKKEYNEEYCPLPLNNEPAPRFACPPFGLVNLMPQTLYWWKTQADLTYGQAGKWNNPFQLTAKNIIDDRQWLRYYNKFIGDPHKRSQKKILNRAIKAYERFMYMAAKYPPGSGELIHPTYVIDVIWHSHMIHPHIYREDSQRYAYTLLNVVLRFIQSITLNTIFLLIKLCWLCYGPRSLA